MSFIHFNFHFKFATKYKIECNFYQSLTKEREKKGKFFDGVFLILEGLVNNHSFQHMFTVIYRLIVACDFSEP